MPPQYYSTNSLKMAVCLRFTVSCLHRGRVREKGSNSLYAEFLSLVVLLLIIRELKK